MPEGDTVYRAAQLLERRLSGHVLVRAELRVPRHATADLVGARVVATVSRGKHLLTRLERDTDRWTLHTHLKMEGIWRTYRSGRTWDRPAFQARAVLGVEAIEAVGFSLGVVDLIETTAEDTVVGHLGPDLMADDFDPDEAVARLRREPDRPVKEALLDQRNLAGIGNVYAAELLFLAGAHPLTPTGEVAGLPRLVRRAQQALDLNKDRTTRTMTGNLRAPLWVYGRDGAACRRCRTTVAKAEQGDVGRERVTYWCPHCQPAR